MSLFPHQKQALSKISGKLRICLFMDTGLGKSRTAIAWARSHFKPRTLVAAPPIVMEKWKQEILAVDPQAKVGIVKGSGKQGIEGLDYVIVSLDSAKSDMWDKRGFRKYDDWCLIIDESHNCKTHDSKRTISWGTFIWNRPLMPVALLTATPITKDPTDLLSQLNMLCKLDYSRGCRNLVEWETRQVPTPAGLKDIRVPVGWKSKAAIEMLIDDYSVVQRKADVLPDLPELRRQTLELPVRRSDIASALEDFYIARGHADAHARACEVIESLEPGNLRGLLEKYGLPVVGDLLHAGGMAKVFPLAEYINANLGDERLLVFTNHRDVAHMLSQAINADSECVTGKQKPQERVEAAARLTSGEIQVLVATYASTGIGIDLVGGNRCLLAELHHSPAVEKQGIDRIHRIGQEKTCLVQVAHAHLDGGIGTFEQRVIDTQEFKVNSSYLETSFA